VGTQAKVCGRFSTRALLSLFTKTEDDARREEAREVAAMGALNAAADLGFFLGPVAGGILAGWGVKWAFTIAPVVTRSR